MLAEALSIAIGWKSQCPDEWLNKMWYVHIMKYYLSTKRNEVLIHAVTSMNLANHKRPTV